MAHLEGGSSATSKISYQRSSGAGKIPGEKYDKTADEIICDESLRAWRLALSHDERGDLAEDKWQVLRKEDEAESMRILKSLADRFPKVSFVKTMMGQVKQHFGKKEEAALYYEEATLENRNDPIIFFKAAEMRRKSGKHDRALQYYRKVIDIQSNFPGAKLGIAQCLLADKNTTGEAEKILGEILKDNPDDAEAKQLLSEIKAK